MSSEQDDDGWPDEDQSDGWDAPEENASLPVNPILATNKSNAYDQIRIFNQSEIFGQMPKKIQKANELLNMDKDDDVIAILRYFNWNQSKLEEKWFEQQE